MRGTAGGAGPLRLRVRLRALRRRGSDSNRQRAAAAAARSLTGHVMSTLKGGMTNEIRFDITNHICCCCCLPFSRCWPHCNSRHYVGPVPCAFLRCCLLAINHSECELVTTGRAVVLTDIASRPRPTHHANRTPLTEYASDNNIPFIILNVNIIII